MQRKRKEEKRRRWTLGLGFSLFRGRSRDADLKYVKRVKWIAVQDLAAALLFFSSVFEFPAERTPGDPNRRRWASRWKRMISAS